MIKELAPTPSTLSVQITDITPMICYNDGDKLKLRFLTQNNCVPAL